MQQKITAIITQLRMNAIVYLLVRIKQLWFHHRNKWIRALLFFGWEKCTRDEVSHLLFRLESANIYFFIKAQKK